MAERVEPEGFAVIFPGSTDDFVGHEAAKRLEAPGEVVGGGGAAEARGGRGRTNRPSIAARRCEQKAA